MSWDFNEGSGKASFTKFPVGITRVRAVDPEPHMRWTHWMNQFGKSVNCPGRACPICDIRRAQKANKETYTYNMGRRFTMNVYNHDTNKMEILEQGITFFEDLRDVMTDLTQDGKKLRDVILKIRRRGTSKDDTSYRIDVDVHEPMNEAEITAMDSTVDMKEYFKAQTPEQILKLLQVTATSPEKYQEAWNEIMTPVEPSEPDEPEDEVNPWAENGDEEIEVR